MIQRKFNSMVEHGYCLFQTVPECLNTCAESHVQLLLFLPCCAHHAGADGQLALRLLKELATSGEKPIAGGLLLANAFHLLSNMQFMVNMQFIMGR
jgi:hypothetical protein